MSSSTRNHNTTDLTSPPDLEIWLLDQANDALFLIDGFKGTVLHANAAAAELTGLSALLLAEMDCVGLFGQDSLSLKQCDRVHVSMSDGTTKVCEAKYTSVIHGGETCGLLNLALSPEQINGVTSVDKRVAVSATEPNSVPEATRFNGDYFRDLLDQIGTIVWEADLPYQGITYISAQLTSVLGYSVDDWLSDPNAWENSILEDDRAATVQLCISESAMGKNHSMEYRARTADGRVVWLEDRITVIKDETGTPTKLRGVMIDITASKIAEEAYRFHQQQHQLLVDHAPVCIHSIDADRRLDSINPKGLSLIGVDSASDVLGKPYLDAVDDVDHKRISKLLDRAYQGKASHFEFAVKTNRGPRTLKSNFIPICDYLGQVRRIIGTSEDVTEANQSIEKLRIQERAIDAARSGILIVDVHNDPYRMIQCNPAFESITGYSRDTILGANGSQLVIDDSGMTIAQFLQAAVQSDHSNSFVKRRVGREDTARHCEVSVSMVRDANERVSHLVCLWADVTDRVIVETQLRQSEHLFRTLSVHSPNGVLLCDDKGRLSYINDEGARILGRSPEDCLGNRWTESIRPNDKPVFLTALAKLLQFGDSLSVEVNFDHATAEPTSALIRLNPRKDDQGRIVGYVGSVVDVTQRNRDVELLAQNEQRFRTMVENAPDAIMIYNVDDDCFVDWNEKAIKLFGFSSDEALGEAKLSQLMPELQPDGKSSRVLAKRYVNRALAGELVNIEYVHVNTQGEQFPCQLRLVNHSTSSPRLIRASLTDVTERRAADEKMRRIRIALENTSDAFFVVAPDGCVVDVNQTTCRQLGYNRSELLTMNVTDFCVGLSEENWHELWGLVKERGTVTVEAEYMRKNGTIFPVEVSATYSNSGQEIAVALARDITERQAADARIRERESQLAHVNRRSTMGELVAGIAHEVNQPLYSILNFAKATNIRLRRIVDDEGSTQDSDESALKEIAGWNEQIVRAATNAGDIIHRMGAFAAHRASDASPSEMDATILDATELIAHELRRANVNLKVELSAGDATVSLDRIEIQQIIVNLIINSIEAIEQQDNSRREIVLRSFVNDQDVVVEVSDSGPGFSTASNLEFFEAFSTTKDNSMGMGLAVVNTLVQKGDGELAVSTSQTGGAAVTFSIPMFCESSHV